jgi:hypothetical protein
MLQTDVLKKTETHILCSLPFFFFFLNRGVCEIMWKNVVELGAGDRLQYGTCLLQAGYIRLQYIHRLCNTYSPLQQRSCMNIAPLVICSLVGQLQSLLYKAIIMGDICKTLVGHFNF